MQSLKGFHTDELMKELAIRFDMRGLLDRFQEVLCEQEQKIYAIKIIDLADVNRKE